MPIPTQITHAHTHTHKTDEQQRPSRIRTRDPRNQSAARNGPGSTPGMNDENPATNPPSLGSAIQEECMFLFLCSYPFLEFSAAIIVV